MKKARRSDEHQTIPKLFGEQEERTPPSLEEMLERQKAIEEANGAIPWEHRRPKRGDLKPPKEGWSSW